MLSLPDRGPLPACFPCGGLAACRAGGAQQGGKPSDSRGAMPPCRDALACQIFSALQQARAGQQYHEGTLGSSVDWPVSLPWLTDNTSDASGLLEATDIQSRYRCLAPNPQRLRVTATLEPSAPPSRQLLGSGCSHPAHTLVRMPHANALLGPVCQFFISSTSQTVFLHLCRYVFSSAAIESAKGSPPAAHSSQLTLVASRFAVNGTWLGFANVTSSQLQLCSGPQAGAGAWLAFGQNYRSAPAFQQLPLQPPPAAAVPPSTARQGPDTRGGFCCPGHSDACQTCCFPSHCCD